MKYKQWTLEKKLEILSKSEDLGVVETCRSYGVSTGTFYNWKKKFEDAIQIEAAQENNITFSITRNKKDFQKSFLKVYTPLEFLEICNYLGTKVCVILRNRQTTARNTAKRRRRRTRRYSATGF